MRGRARAVTVGLLGAVVTAAAIPASASADHHLMKIREVFPGSSGTSLNTEFVELQMYSSGQNDLDPSSRLDFYGPTGTAGTATPFSLNDVAVGATQRTVLAGTQQAAPAFGVTLDTDFGGPLLNTMDPAGGAVCFESGGFGRIDCVSWGSITNAPTGAGTPEAAIPDGSSLERSIAPGCSLLLEAGDDSNDSATDFAPATPSPRNNATAPTEGPCPDTEITKKPKNPTTDRTPRFKFKSEPAGAAFECKLDDAEFEACSSPLDLPRQDRGKHTFRVMAENDATPAKHTWKIVKP